MQKFTYKCINSECRRDYGQAFCQRCVDCGTLVDVFYDLRNVEIHETEDPLGRYSDLLPLRYGNHPTGLTYPRATPCVHARELGAALGLPRLYLKDETVHPTGTTKDRATAVTLPWFREAGINEFIVVSTGNVATSMAHGVAQDPSFRLHIFCGRDFASRVRFESCGRIELHDVDGDLAEAGRAAKAFSEASGVPMEGGFFSIPKREGLKLAYLEACHQMPVEADVVVQAVSSAIGIWSAYRAFEQYRAVANARKMPRLVCVQQESCCPMYLAYRENSPAIRPEHIFHNPKGIAQAILRGDPTPTYPYIKSILDEVDGLVAVANEREIVEATRLVEETERISVGYSAGCAVAGAARLVRSGQIDQSQCVLVNLTGGVGT